MKFLLNSVDSLVEESIDGCLSLHSSTLCRLDGYPSIKVVLDTKRYYNKKETGGGSLPVAVVCGGGSGHEPAFASYAGQGMLSAAVCGDVFASPSESAVLAALRSTITSSGALVVVLNYTGDRLNFGAAVERIKIETGWDARMVIVGDDVALREGLKKKTGARGLSGAMLVLKCAGAVAARGASLDEVERMAHLVKDNVTTMGCSLSTCNVPGKDTQRVLGEGEMEMGLGAHGEAGAYRQSVVELDEITEQLVKRVGRVGEYEDDQKVNQGDDVVVLINNMGGVTQLEMGAIVWSAQRAVRTCLGARVVRLYSGIFLSSLDMKGFSISLLRIPDGGEGEEILRALDAKTEAPGWPLCNHHDDGAEPRDSLMIVPMEPEPKREVESARRDNIMDRVHAVIANVCESVVASADRLNELDGVIGDGDCGNTFRRGFEKIATDESVKGAGTLRQAMFAISDIAGEYMGGSSGALLKIFFFSLASLLPADAEPQAKDIAAGVAMGVERMSFYGGAQKGDSTMLDALIPLSQAFDEACRGGASAKDISTACVAAAREGRESTRSLVAKAGRASYVPEECQKGVTDPGAEAVVVIMEAVDSTMS